MLIWTPCSTFPGSQGLVVIVMARYWGIIEVLATICPVTGISRISWPGLSLHRTHEPWLVAHMAATNITRITHVTHITNTLWQSVTQPCLSVTRVLRDNPHVSPPAHHWWCPHQFPWHWWLLCRHLTLWPGPIVPGVVMAANCSQLIAHLQTKLIADCVWRRGSSRGKSTPPVGHQPGPATDEATNSENDREMRREVVIKIISVHCCPGPCQLVLRKQMRMLGLLPFETMTS